MYFTISNIFQRRKAPWKSIISLEKIQPQDFLDINSCFCPYFSCKRGSSFSNYVANFFWQLRKIKNNVGSFFPSTYYPLKDMLWILKPTLSKSLRISWENSKYINNISKYLALLLSQIAQLIELKSSQGLKSSICSLCFTCVWLPFGPFGD